jgi:hypothetical protein
MAKLIAAPPVERQCLESTAESSTKMASRRRLSNCGLAGEATSHFAFTALPSIAVGEKEEVEQIFGPGGAIEAFEVADPGYLSFEKLVLPVASNVAWAFRA